MEASGFAVVTGVLEPADIEMLARAIERERQRAPLLGTGTPCRFAGRAAPGMRGILEKIPEIQDLCNSKRLRSLVEPILGASAKPVRGLFFDKTASANWGVGWHQDTTIAVRERIEILGFQSWSLKEGIPHVRPPVALLERMLTLRLHLDATDGENGCLWAVPGSHGLGLLTAAQIQLLKRQARSLAVPAGAVLMMRPLLLHASYKATQPQQRRVIHLEFAAEELPEGLRWHWEAFA